MTDIPADGWPSMLAVVNYVVEHERDGRWVTAALALIKLRHDLEASRPEDLAPDERTWPDFVSKHLPFGIGRADELIGRMLHRGGMLQCTHCGTHTACPCACGVSYVPAHPWRSTPTASAIERAAAAIAADPKRSNRAIASEIGVSYETVRRARRQAAHAP